LRDAVGDDAHGTVGLALIDHRPQMDLPAVRVADLQSSGTLGQHRGVLLEDRLMHQVPAGRETDLPLMEKRAKGSG